MRSRASSIARQILKAASPRCARDRRQVHPSAAPWDVHGMTRATQQLLERLRRSRTAARSPWQHAYIERFIGSVRRECLDHLILPTAWAAHHSEVLRRFLHRLIMHRPLARIASSQPVSPLTAKSRRSPSRRLSITDATVARRNRCLPRSSSTWRGWYSARSGAGQRPPRVFALRRTELDLASCRGCPRRTDGRSHRSPVQRLPLPGATESSAGTAAD
jgi:hypothetical protein